MVIVSIQMKVLPQKRGELLQALRGIADSARRDKGCISHNLYQDMEDENRIRILETWEAQKDLDSHWCTDGFSALLGTKHLLIEPPLFEIHAVSGTAGKETVDQVRMREREDLRAWM